MNVKDYCDAARVLATHQQALQVVLHFLDGLPDFEDKFYIHFGLHGWQDIEHAHETTPVIKKILKVLQLDVGVELVDRAKVQAHYRLIVTGGK